MQYQTDYILRLIEQMGDLVRRALAQTRAGGAEEPYELADRAIALALDMDPELIARLSPQSLASLIDINNLDERVIELMAQAMDLEAEILQGQGELVASVQRRDQAAAVRALLGPNHVN